MAAKVVRGKLGGVTVSVSEETAELLGADFEPEGGRSSRRASQEAKSAYHGMKVDDLKAEIEKRNEGRDEAGLLSTEGKKDELIAALEADDNK